MITAIGVALAALPAALVPIGASHAPPIATAPGDLRIAAGSPWAPGGGQRDAQAARRARAYELCYNLDYAEAETAFRKAVAASPTDAAAWRGLAVTAWIQVLYARGSILVADYLGALSQSEIEMPPPSPALATLFRESVDRSLAIAEPRLKARPNDPAALYDVGAALALSVSWTATVEGKVLRAFRSARRAFSTHERALEIDPSRNDAALVAGTYRYAVAQLSAPIRLLAYMVGFGGGKDRGLQLIEQAASHPSDVRADAQLALVLIYNREGRPRDALATIDRLRERLPRNRLLWLEYGATAVRAGLGADAERELTEGLRRLAADPRPRALGEEARWYLTRGAARILLGRTTDARADLRTGLGLGPRHWIRGRIHLELGKAADLDGDRTAARSAYQSAAYFCERDHDPDGASEAHRYLETPYSRAKK